MVIVLLISYHTVCHSSSIWYTLFTPREAAFIQYLPQFSPDLTVCVSYTDSFNRSCYFILADVQEALHFHSSIQNHHRRSA